jgi:SET domain-containing protein
MRNDHELGSAMRLIALLVALIIGAIALPLGAAAQDDPPPARGPILRADPNYDLRTMIAPSQIPKAGMGLFAREPIKAGEVIGELGGQLLEEPDLANPSAYLAGLPDCAFDQMPPYRYLDSKDYGGNVSRANFAPRLINGRETNLQNARIERVCRSPYVLFVATKDISPGQEIWLSYGPDYYYDGFMSLTEVQEFFCRLTGIDCRQGFEFDH